MDQITTLQELALTFVKERDWDQFQKPKDLALSMSLEVGELLEHFQWKTDQDIVDHIAANKEELGDELADILIYCLLFAAKTGIPIEESIRRKMAKNAEKYPIDQWKGNNQAPSV